MYAVNVRFILFKFLLYSILLINTKSALDLIRFAIKSQASGFLNL